MHNRQGRATRAAVFKASGALAIGAMVAVAGATASTAHAAPGDIINLGTFGGQSSNGSAVNASGQATGDAYNGGGDPDGHAFRYDPATGTMHDLGTLGGDSVGAGVNDVGQVVGSSYTAGNLTSRGFRYDGMPGAGGVMRELPTLGGANGGASGINNAGQVAGTAQRAVDGQYHAFRHDGTPGVDGVIHDLGTLPGGADSRGAAINDAGQIVGNAAVPGQSPVTGGAPRHAFRYDGVPGAGGVMRDLGTLGGLDSWATNVNGSGQVVGYSTLAVGARERAFRYDGTPGGGGTMWQLPSLGGTYDQARDITDSGFAVGFSDLPGGARHAVLWRPDLSLLDLEVWLNTANPTAGARWHLACAYGVSENGWIAGSGIYDDGPGGLSDGNRAFLLNGSSLVPEPSSAAAALVTSLSLIARRRRRP